MQGDGRAKQIGAIEAVVEIRGNKALDDATERERTMFLRAPADPISLCIEIETDEWQSNKLNNTLKNWHLIEQFMSN